MRYASVAPALAPDSRPAAPVPALQRTAGTAPREDALGGLQLDSAHAALAELQAALRALDVDHPDLASLWALATPPAAPRPVPGESERKGPSRGTDETGAARLARLLDEKGLRQQLRLGEGRLPRSRL